MNRTSQLTEAIDLALQGQWQSAHELVQALDDVHTAWIHAVLHKIEGDLGNAQYWYRRANQLYTTQDPTIELRTIRQHLQSVKEP